MGFLSKARVGVKKADIWAGTKIFKSKVGFVNSVSGIGKIVQVPDPKLSMKNPQLFSLIKNGYTPFNNSYDKLLIAKLAEKFNTLMKDEKYSYPYSGLNGKVYKREMINPAVNFPELSKLITDDIIKTAEGYYSNGCFTIKHIACGQNYFVPGEIRKNHEMFSNYWHIDIRETSELKYFVYMSDVLEKDGPFHVQSKSRTKELIKMGFDNRSNYNLPTDVLENPKEVQKMTGPVGTSFFGHAAICLHRAGDPDEGHFRNMIQFQFTPSKEKLKKDWIKNVIPHEIHRYDPTKE